MPRVRKYYKQEAEQHIEALLGIYINCQITGICFQVTNSNGIIAGELEPTVHHFS